MSGRRVIRNQNSIRLSDERMLALMMRLDKLTYPEIGAKLDIAPHNAFRRVQSAITIIRKAREGEMRLCK